MRRSLRALGWLASLALAFAAGVITQALFCNDCASLPVTPAAASATAPSPSLAPTPIALTPSALVPAPLIETPLASAPPLTDSLELLTVINAARLAADCRVALAWEPRLAQTAQDHADDLGRRGEIDHLSADGSTYSDRLERTGYQFNRRGENIAAGFAQPLEVLNQWMDEPPDGPHRLNILNCAYQHAGIGRALHPNGYPIWVLDLAEPRRP